MGIDEDIKYWVNIAEYDLESAKAMLEAARYVYVLFMCQQAIEKLLKAHVVKATKNFPPRLHDLLRLLELAKLEAADEDKKFLEKLNYYYLESRYPDARKKISSEVDKNLAENYYVKAKEIFKWLQGRLI